MDRRQIGLKLVMDGLGLPVQVKTFEDRLILQKAVHLAQAAGVDLGYYFRWYLYGPYCPSVAEDGFGVTGELAQGVDDFEGWALDEVSAKKLEGMRGLFADEDRSALARKLELLASVHFLVDRKQVRGQSPEEIAGVLRKYDKQFSAEEVEKALGELRDHAILA